MTLTISKVFISEPRSARCIEVHATGSKGGGHEWSVDFSDKGAVLHGYEWKPPTGFKAEHLIPLEVKGAAIEFYHKEFGT